MKRSKQVSILLAAACMTVTCLSGCGKSAEKPTVSVSEESSALSGNDVSSLPAALSENAVSENASVSENRSVPSDPAPAAPAPTADPTPTPVPDVVTSRPVSFDPNWQYGQNSKINSGTAVFYAAAPSVSKSKTVCVNAGHGTSGGESVRTLCHPDGSAKVTGGSTAAGSTTAMAVASGTTLLDGTEERTATLSLALKVKDRLLAEGYNVLMIRESDDVQLDNIARTLLANNYADIHISLHYDSTESDKGAFYMSPPKVDSYLSMEPVASTYQADDSLGKQIISGLSSAGIRIWENGSLEQDLTQTSYSTIATIDLEVGDRASDHSDAPQAAIAEGITAGCNAYFGLPATAQPKTDTSAVPSSNHSADAAAFDPAVSPDVTPEPTKGLEGVG